MEAGEDGIVSGCPTVATQGMTLTVSSRRPLSICACLLAGASSCLRRPWHLGGRMPASESWVGQALWRNLSISLCSIGPLGGGWSLPVS